MRQFTLADINGTLCIAWAMPNTGDTADITVNYFPTKVSTQEFLEREPSKTLEEFDVHPAKPGEFRVVLSSYRSPGFYLELRNGEKTKPVHVTITAAPVPTNAVSAEWYRGAWNVRYKPKGKTHRVHPLRA